ncbi:DUF952 domain-containing protein [Actinoplanes couchii]|uniref:Glutathione S-transferase n=1 Tax=Actinoplanes couchii TaxID=403638 RepID=A0ABQ3X5I0_9ACTN|nr:DUF952 domain-containing protein [Actinoplanes couchii]MDR6325532.1 uncharacterized protein (DUF952 family) [Actinoplanes couchii]GID53768.1 glutathione S-transferase [Actinoplanes couchii]
MIYHICPREAWAKAQASGSYEADSLGTEGFIHCSAGDWVHVPATLRFRGRTDLVLLTVDEELLTTKDEELLTTKVVWEDGAPPEPDGRQFPHVYGPIRTSAVVAVADYPPRPDGSFAPIA